MIDLIVSANKLWTCMHVLADFHQAMCCTKRCRRTKILVRACNADPGQPVLDILFRFLVMKGAQHAPCSEALLSLSRSLEHLKTATHLCVGTVGVGQLLQQS